MIPVPRKTRQTLVAVTLALASCQGPLQSPTPTPEIVPLYFVTTSSTHPLLRDLSAAYSRENTLIAIVDQSSTGLSLQDALNPTVDSASQPLLYLLTTQLPPGNNLWAAPLGTDAIAIIAHPALRIPALTAADLRAIFSGTVERWLAVDGPDTAITVVGREASSPTRQAFEAQVMGQRSITLRARLATTEAAMVEIIAQTAGAIGFVSMALVTDQVQVIPVRATVDATPVLPSPQTVAAGLYPLQMPLLVVGRRAPVPGDGYYEFILWAQQEGGQRIVAERYAPLP
jgi:phosphate transport system substrate-binding protein